jgi:hypothetical protein
MSTQVGKVSGGFEMVRLDTGERLRIEMDGSEIRDSISVPTVEFCDKCQQTKNLLGGDYATWQGQKILWFCEVCK